ncbi:Metallo-dependent phosphatase-like protein [Cantharellus anzutake]|uniref:Metallo-dependent phosphatase-like protein n=1 Tax=Cantharellus anzutake TaxID=1750568 RepID=UPI001902D03D|nr:Metallo-dependent phosphatase-like protein [Cantharellus anzutake]KAF8333430.1 Metallo-dependent phosphatase-like protein [Cantharellus anzutake]
MISSFAGRLRSATVSAPKSGSEKASSRRLTADGAIEASSSPSSSSWFPETRSTITTEPLPEKIDGFGSTVYLDYDTHDPPPKPAGTTRFICISDTHSQTFPVPEGDVLLHSGDLSGHGRLEDLVITLDWLETLPHKIKIIIAGNHDLVLHKEWYEEHKHELKRKNCHMEDPDKAIAFVRSKAESKGIIYLEDELYKFRLDEGRKEWSVWGSPWSRKFGNWAFGYAPLDAEEIVSRIQPCDILLTHGPPFNILDRTIFRDESVGCPTLANRLTSLKPRLHVFGHIHESHGAVLKVWESPESPSGKSSLRNSIASGTSRLRKSLFTRLKSSQEATIVGQDIKEAANTVAATVPPPYAQLSMSQLTPSAMPLNGNAPQVHQAGSTPRRAPTSISLPSRSTSPSVLSSHRRGSTSPRDVVTETVFVNAANAPMGPRGRNPEGRQVQFGQGAFCPVIVDLTD